MAQFRRSIQPTGFRPEQVSDKNISQLQAYSDRITNALREERDAVISNRNRTADALKENARIQEQQLGRDADIQDRNIQTQIREQDLLAQKARQDFDTNTRASREMFGTLADLSVTASLKLQEIEVERFKNQAVSDYAEVMTLGDNSPKVKITEATVKDAQAEQVKAYTEVAAAQANGVPPVVADRVSKNINELSFGAKVAKLHQLQKQYGTFLNTKFMDGTAQYTDEAGNTFTGQEAARDGRRTGIVAASALKEFMDVNGITGMNAGFLQKSGFLPGMLGANQSAMNSAEKAEREDYQAKFTTDLDFQLSQANSAEDGTAIVQSNWPELVRLYGFQGALDVLQKIYTTTDGNGDPVNDLAGLSNARLGPNGQTFGEYWGKNRMQTIQKTLSQARNAAFQEQEQTRRATATQAARALLPDLNQQLKAADPKDDLSIIATIKKQFFDEFGFIPSELETLERQTLQENKRESEDKANMILEKIRTGQATQGDVMSIADPELRAQVQEQFIKTTRVANYGENYEETLKMVKAAAKQIMGDSLEGSGGLEAQRLSLEMQKNFSKDYKEGLRLYKDPDRALQYATDRLQRDKDAAMLNQDKGARYYSTVGPNNQKVFTNVRSLQARTAAQQNAALDTLRQTLGSVGVSALSSPGILGTETELRKLSEANGTGQVLRFTPQMKEAAKILGITELEAANEAIAAYNRTNTIKIPPLRLDAALRSVNNARPETRDLFTNNPTVQRILRGAAEIQQTSLRDPNYLRGSFRGDAPGVQGVLGMIRSGEGGYTSMFPRESYPQLTNMSISEVVNFQKQKLRDGRKSAAVGAYQFLNPERAAQLAGLPLNAKFTPANQDKMAVAYMIEGTKRPKLAAYLSGKSNDLNAAHLDIAQEWAALAGPSGRGVYDNDGRNKASISAERVRTALIAARKQLSGK
jgi:hypothetical protein